MILNVFTQPCKYLFQQDIPYPFNFICFGHLLPDDQSSEGNEEKNYTPLSYFMCDVYSNKHFVMSSRRTLCEIEPLWQFLNTGSIVDVSMQKKNRISLGERAHFKCQIAHEFNICETFIQVDFGPHELKRFFYQALNIV